MKAASASVAGRELPRVAGITAQISTRDGSPGVTPTKLFGVAATRATGNSTCAQVPRSRPYDVFVMGSSLWTSFSPNANPGPGPPRPVVAVLPIAFQIAVGETPSGPRIRSPALRLSTMTGGPSGRWSGAVSASLRYGLMRLPLNVVTGNVGSAGSMNRTATAPRFRALVTVSSKSCPCVMLRGPL